MNARSVVGLAALVLLVHCGDSSNDGAAGADAGSSVGSGPAGDSGIGSNVDGGGSGSAPPIAPTLLVSTYVGGAGDQYITDLAFDTSGHLTAKMGAATITYDTSALTGTTTGDLSATMDATKFPVNYPLPQGGLSTNTTTDARNGQTYTWGTHPNVGKSGTVCPDQCKGECTPGSSQPGLLQMAFVTSSVGWKLWDFDWDHCVQECVVADSRGYDLFPVANGKVGVMLWTDGGDTPLLHGPSDVTQTATFTQGSFGENPGGMGILFALLDPANGTVSGGTWLATHATYHTTDPWGRVYITKAIPIRYGKSALPQPTNPFAMSTNATSGLFVLRPDFTQPETHFYLGGDPGTCAGSNGIQLFDAVALSGNLLALAGTTCATDLATTPNAVQAKLGGGQDGFLIILKLWN